MKFFFSPNPHLNPRALWLKCPNNNSLVAHIVCCLLCNFLQSSFNSSSTGVLRMHILVRSSPLFMSLSNSFCHLSHCKIVRPFQSVSTPDLTPWHAVCVVCTLSSLRVHTQDGVTSSVVSRGTESYCAEISEIDIFSTSALGFVRNATVEWPSHTVLLTLAQ